MFTLYWNITILLTNKTYVILERKQNNILNDRTFICLSIIQSTQLISFAIVVNNPIIEIDYIIPWPTYKIFDHLPKVGVETVTSSSSK